MFQEFGLFAAFSFMRLEMRMAPGAATPSREVSEWKLWSGSNPVCSLEAGPANPQTGVDVPGQV